MRTLIRSGLVIILTAALAGIPAIAASANPTSAPLGVVMQADRATVGADLTQGGATIYDGDRLGTTDGTLRARLGGPQMLLHPDTTAEVHSFPNGFSANLSRGTVQVSSAQGETFQLVADDATIRPVGLQQTVAQITLVNANELLLSSSRGAIQVTVGDEVKTIEAGSSYRMELDTEDPGPQGSGGPVHTGHNRHALYYVMGAAAAVGVGIVMYRVLESPSAPAPQ